MFLVTSQQFFVIFHVFLEFRMLFCSRAYVLVDLNSWFNGFLTLFRFVSAFS